MSLLIERLNKQYQKELSKTLATKTRDEVLQSVTITEVRITNDLSYATVYFICPNNVRGSVMEALEKAKGFLRTSVAKTVKARKTAELIFKFDNALEYGNHINEILSDIKYQEDEEV